MDTITTSNGTGEPRKPGVSVPSYFFPLKTEQLTIV